MSRCIYSCMVSQGFPALPPPSPSALLVLVGPGIGCVPFHGFVEERAMQDVSGSAAAPIWMFFWLSK
jgi:cytochrome P450/NADPH-cytochrome P450 reductase